METISSVKNERVKRASKLVSSAKARREAGLFVLEGLRLCMDIVRSDLRAAELYVSAEFAEKHAAEYESLCAASDSVFLVNDAVLAKLSDTQTPQGVCAVVRMPERSGTLVGGSETGAAAADVVLANPEAGAVVGGKAACKLLLLENVQDPGNLGAVARTAEALGIDGLVVAGGCDVYSPKALRASMGALLRLPVEVLYGSAVTKDAGASPVGLKIQCAAPLSGAVPATRQAPLLEYLAAARAAGYNTYASTPAADAVPVTAADFSGKVLCVVGNEANGVTPDTMAACDARVTIPMEGRAESLNAAAAAAILMWEMVR